MLEKIKEYLERKNVSFSDFAEHIGESEQELERKFQNNTLEIRTLENISKELKIPLYRFFREPVGDLTKKEEHPIYATITHEELENLKRKLELATREIEILKTEIQHQNQLLINNKK